MKLAEQSSTSARQQLGALLFFLALFIFISNFISNLFNFLAKAVVFFQETTAFSTITLVPTDLSPGDTYHLAFVTSTGRDATSSNIADYDAFVQAAANAAGGGLENISWKVIGSTSTVDAITHIGVLGPVYRLDNTRIADNETDLFDGSIANPLAVTEHGRVRKPYGGSVPDTYSPVFTGTLPHGFAVPRREDYGFALGNSFSIGEQPIAIVGNSRSIGSDWIYQGSQFQGFPIPPPAWFSRFLLMFFVYPDFHHPGQPFYAISSPLSVPSQSPPPIPEPSTLLLLLVFGRRLFFAVGPLLLSLVGFCAVGLVGIRWGFLRRRHRRPLV